MLLKYSRCRLMRSLCVPYQKFITITLYTRVELLPTLKFTGKTVKNKDLKSKLCNNYVFNKLLKVKSFFKLTIAPNIFDFPNEENFHNDHLICHGII